MVLAHIGWSAALSLVLLVSGACNREPAPAAEQPRASIGAAEPAAANQAVSKPAAANENSVADPAKPPAALAGDSAPAAARVVEENFELSLASKGTYQAGKPAQAEIVLQAKGPFHVNDKYPYKFKLKDQPGLVFPATVVGKEAVQLEKAKATMLVPFTAQTAGKHNLTGQFLFSICTDDKCLIEKRDLSLVVDAS